MKRIIILLLLIALWLLVVFTPVVKAESPTIIIKVPEELVGIPIKEYAYNQVILTWDESHWNSFNSIIQRESEWNPKSKNPKSTAYGLGQFLDSTWKGVGIEKTSDPEIQIQATILYIQKRYGDPKKAWIFWKSNLWY